jgi:hypothetical protein
MEGLLKREKEHEGRKEEAEGMMTEARRKGEELERQLAAAKREVRELKEKLKEYVLREEAARRAKEKTEATVTALETEIQKWRERTRSLKISSQETEKWREERADMLSKMKSMVGEKETLEGRVGRARQELRLMERMSVCGAEKVKGLEEEVERLGWERERVALERRQEEEGWEKEKAAMEMEWEGRLREMEVEVRRREGEVKAREERVEWYKKRVVELEARSRGRDRGREGERERRAALQEEIRVMRREGGEVARLRHEEVRVREEEPRQESHQSRRLVAQGVLRGGRESDPVGCKAAGGEGGREGGRERGRAMWPQASAFHPDEEVRLQRRLLRAHCPASPAPVWACPDARPRDGGARRDWRGSIPGEEEGKEGGKAGPEEVREGRRSLSAAARDEKYENRQVSSYGSMGMRFEDFGEGRRKAAGMGRGTETGGGRRELSPSTAIATPPLSRYGTYTARSPHATHAHSPFPSTHASPSFPSPRITHIPRQGPSPARFRLMARVAENARERTRYRAMSSR